MLWNTPRSTRQSVLGATGPLIVARVLRGSPVNRAVRLQRRLVFTRGGAFVGFGAVLNTIEEVDGKT